MKLLTLIFLSLPQEFIELYIFDTLFLTLAIIKNDLFRKSCLFYQTLVSVFRYG